MNFIKMNIIKIKHLLTILIFIGLTGCVLKQKEKEYQYNPIMVNEDFQDFLLTHKIKMVAPASGTDPKKVEKLKSTNFIDIPDNFMNEEMRYHSNSDEERFRYLKNALLHSPNNTIVWSLRGGYGSARLIEKFKKLPKPKEQRIFIGFSDITAIHLFLAQEWQWKTIHGAVLDQLLNPNTDPENFKKIMDIVNKKVAVAELDSLLPLNALAKKNKISGTLTGGNLTIVESSLGTDWQINTDGKILFLEDHKEKGYKLDRSLNHLKQAGVFNNVQAIILGDIEQIDEEVEFALARFAASINKPVYKTNQFGHGRINYPLIYNARSEILKKEPCTSNPEYRLIMHLD